MTYQQTSLHRPAAPHSYWNSSSDTWSQPWDYEQHAPSEKRSFSVQDRAVQWQHHYAVQSMRSQARSYAQGYVYHSKPAQTPSWNHRRPLEAWWEGSKAPSQLLSWSHRRQPAEAWWEGSETDSSDRWSAGSDEGPWSRTSSDYADYMESNWSDYSKYAGYGVSSMEPPYRLHQQAPPQTTQREWTGGQFIPDSEAIPAEPSEVYLVNAWGTAAFHHLKKDATEAAVVAFDAEWRPDWSGSDNPISVLQLAFPKTKRVYVLQVQLLGGKLPVEVQMMLVNPGVTKVGFGVDAADTAKLQRTGIAVTRDSVVDVQPGCAKAISLLTGDRAQAGPTGLKRAAQQLLGVTMDKRLACSDWASDRLTADQIRYAALDAWVTLRLFYLVG
jgi:hypothetical protein